LPSDLFSLVLHPIFLEPRSSQFRSLLSMPHNHLIVRCLEALFLAGLVGQLEYDCSYSKMHGMPVTGGRGFRSLKPLWHNGVPP
jgi:hypothetical protein